jgi:ferritin
MPVTSLLSPAIKALFEKAVESELYASNLYKHIANQMQRLGFFGAQKYFLGESAEELVHYQKLVDYVNDMNDVVLVPEIAMMRDVVNGIGDALVIAYETELGLMNDYREFYKKAEEAEDCVTETFLIEFLQIQRRSVGEYGDLISRFERNPSDVFEFDEFLGEK